MLRVEEGVNHGLFYPEGKDDSCRQYGSEEILEIRTGSEDKKKADFLEVQRLLRNCELD